MSVLYFSSIADFIAMGGHGFYVWIAFGFTIVGLLFLLINPLIRHRNVLKQVHEQSRIETIRMQEKKN